MNTTENRGNTSQKDFAQQNVNIHIQGDVIQGGNVQKNTVHGNLMQTNGVPEPDAGPSMKKLGRKFLTIIGAILLALSPIAFQFVLEDLPEVVIDMNTDPVSGLIEVTLTADMKGDSKGNISYQIDQGRSETYTEPFKITPQQTVSAFMSYGPIKGPVRDRKGAEDAKAVIAELHFQSDGSAVVFRNLKDGGRERIDIPKENKGDVDLVNQEGFGRLMLSYGDRQRLKKAAWPGRGTGEIKVVLRRDDPEDIQGAVWISFWVRDLPMSVKLEDSYLYLPYKASNPERLIAEKIRDPDGLDKHHCGQLARTSADGTMIAVQIPGPVIFEVTERTAADWNFSGQLEPAFSYAVSHGLLHLTETDIWTEGSPVTMSQFITLLYRSQNHSEFDIDSKFVEQKHVTEWETKVPWLGESFEWAKSKCLLFRVESWYIIAPGRTFYVNENISRGEMAVLLWQLCGHPGADGEDPETEQWEELARRWVEKNGLMTIRSTRGMSSDDPVPVEIAALVLQRMTQGQAGLEDGARFILPYQEQKDTPPTPPPVPTKPQEELPKKHTAPEKAN